MYPSKKPMTQSLALLAVAAAGLMAATGASAQQYTSADDKIWSGAQCVPASGISYSAFKIRPSGIENATNVNRYLACTITVDSESTWDLADSQSTADDGRANLFLDFDFSNAQTSTVTCTVQMMNGATGTITETVSNSVQGTAGDSTVSLNFNNLLQGNANSTALGFNCLMPPAVRLSTVNIEEYAETDPQVTYP